MQLFVNNNKKHNYFLSGKPGILVISILMFFNLAFVIPSLITMPVDVYASSSNDSKKDGDLQQQDATDDGNLAQVEQQQPQDEGNSGSSDNTGNEGGGSDSNTIDNNNSPLPSESPTNTNPESDTLITANPMTGDSIIREHLPDNTELKEDAFLTIKPYAINMTKELADTISICVRTEQYQDDEYTMSTPSTPHCSSEVNKTVEFKVHPGKVFLSITKDPSLMVDESPCLIDISLRESKSCTLNFRESTIANSPIRDTAIRSMGDPILVK